ncbi:MAG: hypothetical protein HUJ26_02490 [Planctomycetaceae bacterium]|nr:hypothetical protein [Planctomycetaceae bacterium]
MRLTLPEEDHVLVFSSWKARKYPALCSAVRDQLSAVEKGGKAINDGHRTYQEAKRQNLDLDSMFPDLQPNEFFKSGDVAAYYKEKLSDFSEYIPRLIEDLENSQVFWDNFDRLMRVSVGVVRLGDPILHPNDISICEHSAHFAGSKLLEMTLRKLASFDDIFKSLGVDLEPLREFAFDPLKNKNFEEISKDELHTVGKNATSESFAVTKNLPLFDAELLKLQIEREHYFLTQDIVGKAVSNKTEFVSYSNIDRDERDKWIYEKAIEGLAWAKIVYELQEIAIPNGWGPVSSIQGVRSRAIKYAERNDLPPVPLRK